MGLGDGVGWLGGGVGAVGLGGVGLCVCVCGWGGGVKFWESALFSG